MFPAAFHQIFRFSVSLLRLFSAAAAVFLYSAIVERYAAGVTASSIANVSIDSEWLKFTNWRLELIDGRLEPIRVNDSVRTLELIHEIDELLRSKLDPTCAPEDEFEADSGSSGLLGSDPASVHASATNETKTSLIYGDEFEYGLNFPGTKSELIRRKPAELLRVFSKTELELMLEEELKTEADAELWKAESEMESESDEDDEEEDSAGTEAEHDRFNFSFWNFVFRVDEANELWNGEELMIRKSSLGTEYKFVLLKDEHGLEAELNSRRKINKATDSSSFNSPTKPDLIHRKKPAADDEVEPELIDDEGEKLENVLDSVGQDSELIDDKMSEIAADRESINNNIKKRHREVNF